jgi:hypothetical protein
MSRLQKLIVSAAFHELCVTWLADPDFFEQPQTVDEISTAMLIYIQDNFHRLNADAREKRKRFINPPPEDRHLRDFVHEFRRRTSTRSDIHAWLQHFTVDGFKVDSIAKTNETQLLVKDRATQIRKSLSKELVRGAPPAQCRNAPRGTCRNHQGQPVQFRTNAEGLWDATCRSCTAHYRRVCFSLYHLYFSIHSHDRVLKMQEELHKSPATPG